MILDFRFWIFDLKAFRFFQSKIQNLKSKITMTFTSRYYEKNWFYKLGLP